MYSRNIKIADKTSCLLLGPRATGKTTWLRHVYPEAVYIDLLEARTFNQLSADPQRLGLMLTRDSCHPVIIDEIQKLPALLDEIHRLIESAGYWFILTGSSARKLRRNGVNLLGGRALTRFSHPFVASELGSDFNFDKCLRFGMLPAIHDQDKDLDPDDYLQSYVRTYLKEEVMQEGLTRNLGAFSRFLEAASFSQGQPLNISEVARECQINRKVAESYFEILDDMLLSVRLASFTKRARRKICQHPKFFFFDSGVYRALRPAGPLDAPAEIDGMALETLVLQHLRAELAWHHPKAQIYYWRTTSGLEVDFVVYSEEFFVAIEVKRSRNIHSSDLKGLKAFGEEYPEADLVVLGGGDREEIIDNIRVYPAKTALKHILEIISADKRR